MSSVTLPAEHLRGATAAIFVSAGLTREDADAVSHHLVGADEAGVPSHGILLVPMYIDRLLAGSVSAGGPSTVVSDSGAVAVIDANHVFGQLSAAAAMDLAIAKARTHGVGVVTVRHAFHFGRASVYADAAAGEGMIGVAACNTRPMMPAVGGAEPVVGNNPIAIAVPGDGAHGFTLDMALSEVALGKIRLADARGESIPDHWATDDAGRATTDPAAAISGMLLPMGGAKGFGLALVVEALTGVLSGGAVGREVTGLYADPSVANDSAQFFLALDVSRFVEPTQFADGLRRLVEPVLESRARPDANPIRLPGHGARRRAERAETDGVVVSTAVLAALTDAAERVGADLVPWMPEAVR
ncbi:Ldh family oxidoreductase [Microbacterium radiodurans]|uniref:Ldh family oxidoreductase n=1 Tax=Microbacterium radiodurans TaxID=661398 RepID=A0A5J5IP85_9MICO|nr:Ldh family oxidoreductase [Microbacterium radiodurans]KAA9085443.1 Ldh family oxidoreductase [Microbacterium radiodurans]